MIEQEGVLNSDEHITGKREPCKHILARSGVDVEGQTTSSRSGTGPTEPKVESWCGRNDCDVEGDYVDACDVCKLLARLASLAAVGKEAGEARKWFTDHFAYEDEEIPETLAAMMELVFQWGDAAWAHAGRESERADSLAAVVDQQQEALEAMRRYRERVEGLPEGTLSRSVSAVPQSGADT